MLVHVVLFWLKPGLTPAQRNEFLERLMALKSSQAAHAVYIGRPAPTPPRPVIDASYDYCLTLLFDDMAAHDAYQEEPLHKAFIEHCKPLWDRVQIYDAH